MRSSHARVNKLDEGDSVFDTRAVHCFRLSQYLHSWLYPYLWNCLIITKFLVEHPVGSFQVSRRRRCRKVIFEISVTLNALREGREERERDERSEGHVTRARQKWKLVIHQARLRLRASALRPRADRLEMYKGSQGTRTLIQACEKSLELPKAALPTHHQLAIVAK